MRYFITGGTGSLGHALVKHLMGDFIVYSRDEFKQSQMAAQYPNVCYILGDVRDENRLARAIRRAAPDVIIHAAALKRVDSVAGDPEEVYKTNVGGSMNVLAAGTHVGKIILISSDKACYPTNAYGISKAMAERLFKAAGRHVIRYGNVLNSRGSVLQVWRQVPDTEPIPVTDVRMTRFWLTLRQAVWYIDKALDLSPEIPFIPTLKGSHVVTLARAYRPACLLKFTGLRPGGEKLHETLITHEEADEWRVASMDSCMSPRYSSLDLHEMLKEAASD